MRTFTKTGVAESCRLQSLRKAAFSRFGLLLMTIAGEAYDANQDI
jgi:hypothetical protein